MKLTDPNEVKHMAGALRLGPGQEVELADGRGSLARAEIEQISKKEVTLRIRHLEQLVARGEGTLCVAQSMLKGARMDWMVEKLVECGVDSLWTFSSRHSVPEEGAFEARRDRWDRIIFAALKQSGAPFGLRLEDAGNLTAVLSRAAAEGLGVVLLDPSPDLPPLWKALDSASKGTHGIVLVVGPEGGFAPEEIDAYRSAGAELGRLSSAVLRGETAAISASSVARHWIDFFSPWAINGK